MTTSARALGASAVLLALLATHARAQSPDTAALQRPAFSIGQPLRWKPYAAGLAIRDASATGATLLAGVYRPIFNPVSGLLGASAEGYGTANGSFAGGGVRVLATSRFFGLSTGADWNLGSGRHGRVDWMLSFRTAIRRGGLVGHGTMLRADWLPTRAHSFAVGLSVPLMQPLAGRTRPRETEATLRAPAAARTSVDAPLPQPAIAALQAVDSAATRLTAYTNLWSDADARAVAADARGYDGTIRDYDAALAVAFAAAAGDSASGVRIARRARAGLFDDVLVPYDSLFGRLREHPADIPSLGAAASASLARWLADSSGVPAAARPAVLAVHDRWLGTVRRIERLVLGRAHDRREVWLPLRLALAPEDHDEQGEVDSLVARLVGSPFTDQNALTYLRSTDLPVEIARSIYAARDYHVIWVHDFAGVAEGTRALDSVSYEMVADAYLPALTAAVRRYDQTGRIPLYMIVLDEYWYEVRNGRVWMDILQDPLHARIALPGDHPQQEAHLRQRQAELRAAAAGSARLQRDARRAGGDAWLRDLVSVHVNITQPSDFSFRSHHIVPPIPFVPDNLMRDHRKIVLYDLNERDPYAGAMLLMGIGIGEQYAAASWEDRGYRLRGPAALEARAALRRLLRLNGFSAGDIPAPLREVRNTTAVQANADQKDYVGRVLQVHNDVGFGEKQASVARAALYDLAAPGSVVIVPDPLWVSATWGGMLAAAAARGAQVQVIAPALPNAPSPQKPLMAEAHDLMVRLLELRQALRGRLQASGGALRVGIFAGKAPVNDVEGRRREAHDGLARAPWIRQLIPFDSATVGVFDRAQARTVGGGGDATTMVSHEPMEAPKLHQKTQLIARPGAIAVLAREPGWDVALARGMEVQSRQTARFAAQLGYETPAVDEAAVRNTDAMLRGFERDLPEAERKRFSFYFTVGSMNEDPRGMVSDGEAMFVTSGFQGATGLVDLYYLMARSTWVNDRAELERYLPAPSRLSRWLGRLIRPTL